MGEGQLGGASRREGGHGDAFSRFELGSNLVRKVLEPVRFLQFLDEVNEGGNYSNQANPPGLKSPRCRSVTIGTGGLVFKAHSFVLSLNSRLEGYKEEEEEATLLDRATSTWYLLVFLRQLSSNGEQLERIQ